jgi:hypothetical protein
MDCNMYKKALDVVRKRNIFFLNRLLSLCSEGTILRPPPQAQSALRGCFCFSCA